MPYVEFVLHLEARALERLEFADTVLLAFSDDAQTQLLRTHLRGASGG
jgi:hypothetical protein